MTEPCHVFDVVVMKKTADAASALAARDKVNRLLVAAREGDATAFQEAARVFDDGHGLSKAILDVRDANGRGCLHFAAQNGNVAVCSYLLDDLNYPVDLKDNDGETPLIHAARRGHFEASVCLLNHGADYDARGNELDATALHHAAAAGSVDIVKLLLEKGINVDISSDAGSPLIWAAGHEHCDVVKVLLEYGANPNAASDDDVTALISAAAAGSLEILDLLIEKGANVNVTVGGVTPLHVAADSGNEKMVISLLTAGADPNVVDEDGEKALMVAAMKGSYEAVNSLLPVTTRDPRIKDWSSEGVLSYAQQLMTEGQRNSNSVKEQVNENKECDKFVPIEVSPERKEKSLEAKARGDDAFKIKNYMVAIDAYTQALDLDPHNATVLSNRSLCWMRIGQPEQALSDAKLVRQIRPDWSKGCYREGSALRLLQKYEEAANAFYEGVKLDPNNRELVNAFREAVEAGKQFYANKSEVGDVQ